MIKQLLAVRSKMQMTAGYKQPTIHVEQVALSTQKRKQLKNRNGIALKFVVQKKQEPVQSQNTALHL